MFSTGVEKGFYARVSRLGSQWLELDLHFLSLGGGEIALGWWFEECLVPYLVNTSKLEAVQSISIVTGYGKTRSRGARMNDDGMRLRVKAMLKHMSIKETPQPNKGRIHINKQELIDEVKKNDGKVVFDHTGYTRFKEEETTSNKFPDVPQQVRARFRPARPGEGPPGTFIREGMDNDPPMKVQDEPHRREPSRHGDSYSSDRRESGRPGSYSEADRGQGGYNRGPGEYTSERRGSFGERGRMDDNRGGQGDVDRRGSWRDEPRRGSYSEHDSKDPGGLSDRRNGYNERRGSYGEGSDRRGRYSDGGERRGSQREWEPRNSVDRRPNRDYDMRSDRDRYRDDTGPRDDARMEDVGRESRRFDDRDQKPRPSSQRSSYYGRDDNQGLRHSYEGDNDYGGRGRMRDSDGHGSNNRHFEREPRDFRKDDYLEPNRPGVDRSMPDFQGSFSGDRQLPRDRHSAGSGEASTSASQFRQKRTSDSALYMARKPGNEGDVKEYPPIKEDPDPYGEESNDPNGAAKKRSFDDYRGQTSNRGYNIEPAYSKRRSV
jgi:hypothetical protein